MSLKTEVFSLLENMSCLCVGCPEAGSLAETVHQMRKRLESPLRVAVVGIMKAGKSTFMNALMGADILYTGDLETTYTVCWFRYGAVPALTVCFRDGGELNVPFEDLQKWSVRKYEAENPRINDVKYLIIHYPAEVLKTLEFIDTPGLNSVYGTDAQNTLDFLSIKSTEDTLHEAGMADAVIYAFSRTASGFDQDILRSFHSGNDQTTSPINSVGIMTKVDVSGIWNVLDETTPTEAAKAVTDNVMKNAGMKQLLFTVLPVCAKVCEGYAQLEERDWQAMQVIASHSLEDLQDCLYDAREFTVNSGDFEDFGSREDRSRLMRLLGQYGILEIARQLQAGKSREEIGQQLQKICGVQDVRDLLFRHFGNRTFLIKTHYIFSHLMGMIHQLKRAPGTSVRLKHICGQISDGIDDLMSSVQTLKELKGLQMYYNGQLQFLNEEEKQDFLRVTGEYGRSAEARLGVSGCCTVAELAAIAQKKVSIWHGKAASGWMMPGAYVEAASIIARSYEQMYFYLNALSEE